MRTTILLMLTFFASSYLLSQDEETHPRYELFGSVSYNYSNTKSQWTGESNYYILETHSVSFQPTGGYFLTKNIELLIDVQYTLSFTHDNSIKYWDHTLGFDIGASYNIQINPFLSVFLGSKIGLNWRREIYEQFIYNNDHGWSKRQVSFPIFLLGGRFAVTKDCSILALVEYINTDLYSSPSQWTKNNKEDVSFGIGFSVFL